MSVNLLLPKYLGINNPEMLNKAPLLHFSLMVDNLDQTVAFYTKTFGFEVSLPPTDLKDALNRLTNRTDIQAKIVQLTHPYRSDTLEFISIVDQQRSSVNCVPFAHVAFSVPNLEKALAEVTAAGGTLFGEVVTFEEGKSAYCFEPGGSAFELEELF